MANAFLRERSRMLVTLALGDSRLVYAVICPTMDDLNSSGASIDESPRIPESLREGTGSLSNVFPSVSQTKERSARRSSIDLRYFFTTCLPWHAGKKRGRNLNRALRALTLDYVSYIRGSSKFNS